jgi:PPOX class probable F420-dependent enzyme
LVSRSARERFAAARVARLATASAAAVPHLVPVVFALENDYIALAVDAKPKTTTRLRRLDNIAATGRVSLLVDAYDEDWSQLWWVRVDGVADIVAAEQPSGTAAIDALVAKYPQYAHARPAGPAIIVRDLRWRAWEFTPHPGDRDAE